jgi:hypothetical protein
LRAKSISRKGAKQSRKDAKKISFFAPLWLGFAPLRETVLYSLLPVNGSSGEF